MKNIWKGMALGAFTGAAIGIVMDTAIRGGQRAAQLGSSAKHVIQEKAPEAREWAEMKGQRATDWAKDDLPDKAQHVVDRLQRD